MTEWALAKIAFEKGLKYSKNYTIFVSVFDLKQP